MFPAFQAPEVETVGARRNRKRESKRASTSTSFASSGSTTSSSVNLATYSGSSADRDTEKKHPVLGVLRRRHGHARTPTNSLPHAETDIIFGVPPIDDVAQCIEETALNVSIDKLQICPSESVCGGDFDTDNKDLQPHQSHDNLTLQAKLPPFHLALNRGSLCSVSQELPDTPTTIFREGTPVSNSTLDSAALTKEAEGPSAAQTYSNIRHRARLTHSSVRLSGPTSPAIMMSEGVPQESDTLEHDNVKITFARTVKRMQNAELKVIATSLSEDSNRDDGDRGDESNDIIFKQRLWSLTAYRWLMQGKSIQSSHGILLTSSPTCRRRILHIDGDIAEGWFLAVQYPFCSVYSLVSQDDVADPKSYSAPANHHVLYLPNAEAELPFADSYFDCVISYGLTEGVPRSHLLQLLGEYSRVLKPGSWLEVISIDRTLSRQGPLVSLWINRHTLAGDDAHCSKLIERLTQLLPQASLGNTKQVRIALPVNLARPRPGDNVEAARVMTFLGRYIYRKAFGRSKGNEKWFWRRRDLRNECQEVGAGFVITVRVAQKSEKT